MAAVPVPNEAARFILAIDLGTTGVRVGLVDHTSQISHIKYEKIEANSPHPGYKEIDPDWLYNLIVRVIRESVEASGIQTSQIASVGITTNRGTNVTWNFATQTELTPLMTWQDQRATEIVNRANSSCVMCCLTSCFKCIHCCAPSARTHTLRSLNITNVHGSVRLRWVLDNIPGALDLANAGNLCFGTVDSWLLWRLTGKTVHATDVGCISASGLYDPFELTWSSFIFKLFQFPATIRWPEVKSTSGFFGNLHSSVLGVEIPIMSIVADQQASLFGQGCYNVGDAKVTLGTGGFVNINTGNAAGRSKYTSIIPLIAWKINDQVTYMMESRARTVGTIIDWGKRFGLFQDASQIDAIMRATPSTGGVSVVSSFFGLEAPHDDDSTKGSITGVSTDTTPAHVARALVESLCFQVEELYRVLVQDTPSHPPLHIDGGVSQSDEISQLIATLTGVPVERGVEHDSTLLGAAHLAGLASNFWKNIAECKSSRKIDRVFQPQPISAELRLSRQRWTESIKRARKWPFASSPTISSTSTAAPVTMAPRALSNPATTTTAPEITATIAAPATVSEARAPAPVIVVDDTVAAPTVALEVVNPTTSLSLTGTAPDEAHDC